MGEDFSARFRTHAAYLRAFSWLAWDCQPLAGWDAAFEQLAARIRSLGSFARVKELKTADKRQIEKSLRNAWGTESILRLSGKFAADEVLSLANAWGVVQTYYVFYHATQALALASGAPRPESHPKTQRIFNDRWVRKPGSPAPWGLGLDVDGFRNAGAPMEEKAHPWEAFSPERSWTIAGVAIRTTRERLVQEKQKEMREGKRRANRKVWLAAEEARIAAGRKGRKKRKETFPLPQLTNEEKLKASEQVGAVSVMDYLWRLRIVANYGDSTVFVEGPEDEQESRAVFSALCRLASTTLLLHELFIRQYIGRDALATMVDCWLDKNVPPGLQTALNRRRALLLAE